MVHGAASAGYNDQGGKRGSRDVASSNWLMGMARRGYPLLLQTGGTPLSYSVFVRIKIV